MIPEGPTSEEAGVRNGRFLCGVVEGFYGKPWSTEQRRKLFRRMKKMGMNTYLYAPKDDCKHRMYWRDLYSVEEADHLTGLIDSAKENAVDFVYALSPGLDITFSNSKDVMHLKRKLEQVASFGCKSFALLFDDIEVDMCDADKAVFQSFAHAQVSVSNETYQYLSQPNFLFCPTEYCATRAVPNVATSEYLTTIGAKLLPGIDVMWTGPRVVSKKISIQSIEEVSKVLQRPPVIWDNIHANDYDPKRVFLGPYDGRLPELIPYLNGVLTNPNCEFEANYIAMHTLAQWCRSNQDGVKKDIILSTSPVTADIKLETETECSDIYLNSTYQPMQALKNAVTDWLEDIHEECREPKKPLGNVKPTAAPIPVPPVDMAPPVQTAPAIVPGACTNPVSIPSLLAQAVRGVDNINELSALVEVNASLLQPSTLAPMNSLIDSGSSDSESESGGEPAVEPMDCVVTPGSSPVASPMHDLAIAEVNVTPELPSESKFPDTMQVEPVSSCPQESGLGTTFTHDEILQLVDLFYLPLDHGHQSVQLLNEFTYIRTSAHIVNEASMAKASPEKRAEAAEWQQRCVKLQNDLKELMDLMDRFCYIPNRTLVYDLFPYLWDLRETFSLVITFLKWLGSNKLYRDAFLSGDHEPWFFRGGLQAEFQRLMSVEGMPDLLTFPVPQTPTMTNQAVRSYIAQDEAEVYAICRRTCDDGADGTDIFPDHPDLIGDKLIGAMLALSPEFAFVIEGASSTNLAGYVLATLDAKQFSRKSETMWVVAMQEKYPKPTKEADLSPVEEVIMGFYDKKEMLPDMVYDNYPARLSMSLLPAWRSDVGLVRRSLLCALAALKAHGSRGVHVKVGSADRTMMAFYAQLGFFDIPVGDFSPGNEDFVYMGRLI